VNLLDLLDSTPTELDRAPEPVGSDSPFTSTSATNEGSLTETYENPSRELRVFDV